MIVTVLSAFRNAADYIDRYCTQMEALQMELDRRGDRLNLVCVYGDSQDGTGAILFERLSHALGAYLFEVNHGGKHYGSIVHPIRFRQLSVIANALLSKVPPDSDIVVIVESDLVWRVEDMMTLIGLAEANPGNVYAPMVFHAQPPTRFYDTFAFIGLDGNNFSNDPPYHDALTARIRRAREYLILDPLIEVQSAGSCLVMAAELVRGLSVPETDVIVGLCRQAREAGAHIYVHTEIAFRHP